MLLQQSAIYGPQNYVPDKLEFDTFRVLLQHSAIQTNKLPIRKKSTHSRVLLQQSAMYVLPNCLLNKLLQLQNVALRSWHVLKWQDHITPNLRKFLERKKNTETSNLPGAFRVRSCCRFSTSDDNPLLLLLLLLLLLSVSTSLANLQRPWFSDLESNQKNPSYAC